MKAVSGAEEPLSVDEPQTKPGRLTTGSAVSTVAGLAAAAIEGEPLGRFRTAATVLTVACGRLKANAIPAAVATTSTEATTTSWSVREFFMPMRCGRWQFGCTPSGQALRAWPPPPEGEGTPPAR